MDNSATITDQFGRVHNYLRISLTEKCNLRCFYCMPERGLPSRNQTHFMTKEEVLGISEIFTGLGIKKIRLTGGEPLLCKDAEYIIRGLAKLPAELAITSNGVLIDKFLPVLKETGLISLNISLDSLKKEKQLKITRRDHFRKIIRNIGLLTREGFNVKVNVVLIKGINEDEIVDFVSWGMDKNLCVRFIEYMPFKGNNWDWGKGISQTEILDKIKKKFGSSLMKIADSRNDTSRNYKIDGALGSFAIISSITKPFCGTCNRIRLTADGKIKNCLFSGSETDLLTPFRKGENIKKLIFGSIHDKKAVRGGIDHPEDFINPYFINKNRSMVAIGG